MRAAPALGQLATIVFLLALTLAVLIPANPRWQKLPSFDSGVFLYTGARVTEGALPYRDVWDHKPPLIFYIDALGLWLSGGSRWGVWALEVGALFAAAAIGFRSLARTFGVWCAVYATTAWMVNAFVAMDGGNYTTEYGLPLQFGMLALVGFAPDGPFSVRRGIALGVLSGLLFWLKQNDIGIPLAVGVYLLLAMVVSPARCAYAKALAAMVGGAVLVTAVVVLPFAVQGALAQFWDAAFLFNFVYIEETWFDRLVILRYVPMYLPALGLTLFAIIGWLVAALTLAPLLPQWRTLESRWGEALDRIWGTRTEGDPHALGRTQTLRLLGVACIALPIELFFVSLSGNAFDHYFLALLPVFAVLGGFMFRLLLAQIERAGDARFVTPVFVAVFVAVFVVLAVEYVHPMFVRITTRQNDAIVRFIDENTTPNDRIFFWDGSGSRVLVEANRLAVTRFIYMTPVVRSHYGTETKALELLTGLEATPPRLVLTTDDSDTELWAFPFHSAQIEQRVAQLRGQYGETAHVGGWTVYERRP